MTTSQYAAAESTWLTLGEKHPSGPIFKHLIQILIASELCFIQIKRMLIFLVPNICYFLFFLKNMF